MSRGNTSLSAIREMIAHMGLELFAIDAETVTFLLDDAQHAGDCSCDPCIARQLRSRARLVAAAAAEQEAHALISRKKR
jgi:hypothetical protein